MNKKILVVIPTYNEIENIEILISQLIKNNNNYDLLFLDDNSPDKTYQVIEQFKKKYQNIHLIIRPKKLGIGSAHLDGILWAYKNNYEKVVTMDSDLTHSPEIIESFLKSSKECDVLVGSRFINKKSLQDWSMHRFFLTHLGHFLTKFFLSLPYDATGGFRIYNIKNINKNVFTLTKSKGYAFLFESLYYLYNSKYLIYEKEIMLPKRAYGNSKMKFKDISHSLQMLCLLYLKKFIFKKKNNFNKKITLNEKLVDKERYEWDEYWSKNRTIINSMYSLVAMFYRLIIIKPTLNYFIQKHFNKNSLLLHAGCGGGQVDTYISKKMQIVALDISPKALIDYQLNHSEQNKIVHGSIFDLSDDNNLYDGIFNLGVMEHFYPNQVIKILNEFNLKLKKDGKIILFWPPNFGLSVRFLRSVKRLLRIFKKNTLLHPPEVFLFNSINDIQPLLKSVNLQVVESYFGIKDLYTHYILVLKKIDK